MRKTPHVTPFLVLHAEDHQRKENEMPKVSKASAAEVQDIGIGTVRTEVVEGYEINFLDLHEGSDMAPLLKGLPNDQCPCHHWGYVMRGSLTFTFADHTEVFEAGDAFYVTPGHSPASSAGTEYLLISPDDELSEQVNQAIERNVEALQST